MPVEETAQRVALALSLVLTFYCDTTTKIDPLVDLWNPLEHEAAAKVKEAVPAQWAAAFSDADGGVSLKNRRARVLLQALGFLDIDFVQESRRPVFRSWGQPPQIETEGGSALVARQCRVSSPHPSVALLRMCIRLQGRDEGCTEDGVANR